MDHEPSPTQRIFSLTPEWYRFFALVPAFASPMVLLLIFVAVLTLWELAPSARLLTLLTNLGLYGAYYLLYSYYISLLIRRVRHIVTSEGIIFCSPVYRISTPWQNIRGIGTSRLGIYQPAALLLHHPAVKGPVDESSPIERATIQRRRWLTNQKYAPDDAIPLLFTVPKNWQESELGLLIGHYAPQAFPQQSQGSAQAGDDPP
jgi:hypothetical protein